MSEINPEEIFDTRLLRALADAARKRGENESREQGPSADLRDRSET